MADRISLAPEGFDRALAAGATAMLAVALIATAKGFGDWARVPPMIWFHLVAVLVALALTPLMLLRRRGDLLHRSLGYVWIVALGATALFSFGIQVISPGQFSLIHLLSVWTLIQIPIIIWSARSHNHKAHRRAIRGMVLGALIVAGFFTLTYNRLLGQWLMG